MDSNYVQFYELSKDCLFGNRLIYGQHLQLTVRMDRTNIVRLWLCINVSLVTAKELKISMQTTCRNTYFNCFNFNISLALPPAFWVEPVQRAEFETDIASVLKELKTLQLDTRISDAVVQLSRTDDQQDMDSCE